MQVNGENCTDHADYTDAGERRLRKIRRIRTELNSPRIARITRMQMNRDSVRSEIRTEQNKANYPDCTSKMKQIFIILQKFSPNTCKCHIFFVPL